MEFNELVESLGNNVTQLRNSDLNKTITELQNMVGSNLTMHWFVGVSVRPESYG